MKKILVIILLLFNGNLWSQGDSLIFENEIQAGNHVYGLLNPEKYKNVLLNKAISSNSIINNQIQGNFNVIYSPYDYLDIYTKISLSYSDTSLFPNIYEFIKVIESFYLTHDTSLYYVPFSVNIHNVSYIDSADFIDYFEFNNEGQLLLNDEDNYTYKNTVLNSASILEFYPDNGFSQGILTYDERFVVSSEDVEIKEIWIDVNNGTGFQLFNEMNPFITFDRKKDSTLARCKIKYELNDSIYSEKISFYITTASNSNNFRTSDSDLWDDSFTGDYSFFNGLTYEVGIKYGCGNNGKIRRPVIISPAYRPVIQAFSLNEYWEQFNIEHFYDSLVTLGYDVIFIKEVPGNKSLEVAGKELARFIVHINELKRENYPNEYWETIVMGYSAGGQKSRYALKMLEKFHMEENMQDFWSHPHTRLYIPFDSPHHGANIPLFCQAVYENFRFTNPVAASSWASLVDPASSDMGYYTITNNEYVPESNVITRRFIPHPEQAQINFQYELSHNFNHFYTPNDTRKTFPSFSRNVAVSTGSYKDDYNMKWGLFPGKNLFTQHGPGYVLGTGMGIGVINREIWPSKYTTNDNFSTIYKRNDFYLLYGAFPIYIHKKYETLNALEFDMAQGGYKNNFYDKLEGGPITILRLGAFGLGQKHYDKKMSFLPLVSALAINPNIWQTNNVNGTGTLRYNLQNEELFYSGYSNGQLNQTDNYGYPHLGHPINHFNITPFEAVYADVHTYDHIVMYETVQDFGEISASDLERVRNFIVDEVESYDFYLQNFVIGHNHVLDPNYEYEAWYKARGVLYIGHNVTPKTDPGDYIIQSTGNITTYAVDAVHIKPGFHAQAGSEFHAFIQVDDYCTVDSVANTRVARGVNSNKPDASNTNKANQNNSSKNEEWLNSQLLIDNETRIELYPNPNTGQFTFIVDNLTNVNGQIFVYNLTGQMVYHQTIITNKTQILPNLEKGMYIVEFKTSNFSKSLKMIVQ